jgi:hypothetical protein
LKHTGIIEARSTHENQSIERAEDCEGRLGASLVARGSHSCFAHPVLAPRLHLKPASKANNKSGKKDSMKNMFWLALVAVALIGAGCKEEGSAEKAGKELDKAADKAVDASKDAANKTGDAIKDATK